VDQKPTGPGSYSLVGATIGVALAVIALRIDASGDNQAWCAETRLACTALFGLAGAIGGWTTHRLRPLRSRGAVWNLGRWVLTCTGAGAIIGVGDVLGGLGYDNFALAATLGCFIGVGVWATQEYLSPSGSGKGPGAPAR
jgi:hypothetical protein